MEPGSLWSLNRLRTSPHKSQIFKALSLWVLGSEYKWSKLQCEIFRHYEVCSDSRFDRSASGDTILSKILT